MERVIYSLKQAEKELLRALEEAKERPLRSDLLFLLSQVRDIQQTWTPPQTQTAP